MLDEKDLQKMVTILATKEDIQELREDSNHLREVVQSLVIAVDKLVKATESLTQEHIAVSAQIGRHEKWLHLLAEKVGMRLEY